MTSTMMDRPDNAPESTRTVAATPDYEETLPIEQVQAGIRFLTGGTGLREAIAIRHAMHDFPLALEFRIEEHGKERYLTQVAVTIGVLGGKVVLSVPSAGPFLLARLRPGMYEIIVEYNGRKQRQVAEIRANGGERLVLEWKVS